MNKTINKNKRAVEMKSSSSAVPALFDDGDIEETMETSILPNKVDDIIITK